MDPRTSAKVTAPDLLEAFHESAPRQGVETTLKVFVVFVANDDVTTAVEYDFSAMTAALVDVANWLTKGSRHGAFVIVDDVAPQLYLDAVDTVSAEQD